MFFQHLSHSTLPPSIWIQRPSSMRFSQRTHTRARGGARLLVDAPLRRCSSRPEGNVGLVCERVGSFGDLATLSRCVSANGREDVLAVGESGPSSSRRVSIARSIAPVDLETVRAVEAERERFIMACGESMVEEEEDE